MNKFILDNEPKINTGFTVPENYFENFEVRFPTEKDPKKTRVIQLFAQYKIGIISVAALLLLFCTLFFQWTQPEDNSYATEIENHLLYHSTLSDDDIVNLLDEETISNIKINSSIENKVIEETLIEDSAIETYLTN
jgi:hypothetical protein